MQPPGPGLIPAPIDLVLETGADAESVCQQGYWSGCLDDLRDVLEEA